MKDAWLRLKTWAFSGIPFIQCVKGYSMFPTLRDGQIVLFNPFARTYNRGDIVIADHDGIHIIKRIIALEGDKVYGRIIPPGHVWLEGDNTNASADSRSFGAIRMKNLIGRVMKC